MTESSEQGGELIIPETGETETHVAEGETAAENGDVLSPEDMAAITEAVAFINRTISEKALETALLIGNYVLSRFFNDDPEAAFSRNPHKPVSFGMICDHPDLRLRKSHLNEMVRVAAQEKFFMECAVDVSPLNYSHRVKLIGLANDEAKVDMARQCVTEHLTVPQLAYRVRRRKLEMQTDQGEMTEVGDGERAAAVNAAIDLAARLDKLIGQVTTADVEWFTPFVGQLPEAAANMVQTRLTTLIDAFNDAETRCHMLLEHLRPPSEHS